MAESSVRVGLRIRPLVSKERGQNLTIDSFDESSLVFKGQTFTFDHVFGTDLSQNDLYYKTAAPMLKNFLEGYNCTIMAYGQTGSGKTYTMGTSDVSAQDLETQGLIPRFVNDLFENLEDTSSGEAPSSYKIKVSFLEIYGEDVFDLINVTASGGYNRLESRASLPVREDESGKVFVQGQTELEVFSATNALEILSSGTHNRVTASTNMNAGSSRSHAVFTLTLEQSIGGTGSQDCDDVDGPNSTSNTVISKLTFVDLAGSERIKRTGAEGQRMKEGIQINSGLFNLGQVINCLADEQKLKNGGKAAFVPYRNSKLTHLLKDALGGNSQTLFLACVSPAESNDSETHSTLNYARQARNIQNKPIRNMDKQQYELMRLKATAKVWMMKAVQAIFKSSTNGLATPCENTSSKEDPSKSFRSPTRSAKAPANGMLSPSASTFMECQSAQKGKPAVSTSANNSADDEALLKRPEVQEFINAVNASILEKLQGSISVMTPTPRKIRLSMGFAAPAAKGNNPAVVSKLFSSPPAKQTKSVKITGAVPNTTGKIHECVLQDFDDDKPCTFMHNRRGHRESILMTSEITEAMETVNQLDESEQLVERMMNVINKEKRLFGVQSMDNDDDNDTVGSGDPMSAAAALLDNEEKIQEVDRLIQEKEEILEKLKDNMKGYAMLKNEFEKLVDEINNLEDEKNSLEVELDKAKKTNMNAGQLDKMKERVATVTKELKKMKEEKTNKETAVKFMQKENKQFQTMQQEVSKLKDTKVSLMKQQKQSVAAYQKLKKESTNQVNSLKKADVKKQQILNALKADLIKKERIIGHKERELSRMLNKLKACEDHITQLLKLQHIRRQKVTGNTGTGNNANANNVSGSFGPNIVSSKTNPVNGKDKNVNALKVGLENHEVGHYFTSRSLLDQLLVNQVETMNLNFSYQQKGQELQEFNRLLQQEVNQLQTYQTMKKSIETSGKFGEGADDSEDEEEDDDDFDGLDAMQLLSEEARYELEIIINKIQWSELEIERLSKYIDTYNTDLDELSLQLETTNASSVNVATSENMDGGSTSLQSWEVIGKDVVFGLSIAQAQNMLLELLQDKCQLLENSKQQEYKVQKSQQEYHLLTKRYEEAIKQLESTRKNCLQKIALVEKQRISEVWTILKANSPVMLADTAKLEGMLNAPVGASTDLLQSQATQTAQNVAIAHAQALEQVISSLKQQVGELQNREGDFRGKLNKFMEENQELKMNQKLIAQHPIVANAGGDASEGNSLISTDIMSKLNSYWNKIGTSYLVREEMLSHINISNVLLQDRIIHELQGELASKDTEITAKIKQMELFAKVLQRGVPSFLPSGVTIHTIQTSARVTSLKTLDDALNTQYALIIASLPKVESLREYMTELMEEMWLTEDDIGAQHFLLTNLLVFSTKELQHILRLPSEYTGASMRSPMKSPFRSPVKTPLRSPKPRNTVPDEDEDDGESENVRPPLWNEEKFSLIFALVKKCHEMHVVITNDELTKWESELKSINVKRIQLTNQIINTRDSIWKQMEELEMITLPTVMISPMSSQSKGLSGRYSSSGNEKVRRLSTLITSANLAMEEEELSPEIVEEQKRLLELLHSLYGEHKSKSNNKLITAIHQILCKKSLSNPPGSALLLSAMQKLPEYLTNIQSSRVMIGNLLKHFVDTFIVIFDEEYLNGQKHEMSIFSLLSEGLEDIPFHQQSNLSLLFMVLHEIQDKLLTLQQQHYEKVLHYHSCLYKFLVTAANNPANTANYQVMDEIEKKINQFLTNASAYYHQLDPLVSTANGGKLPETFLSPSRIAGNNHNNSNNNNAPRSRSPTRAGASNKSPAPAEGNASLIPLNNAEEDGGKRVLQLIATIVNELSGCVDMQCRDASKRVEEPWLVKKITSLIDAWRQPVVPYARPTTTSKAKCMKKAIVETYALQQEHKRFLQLYEVMQELYKYDAQLHKTITELDEFEQQSRQDRMKILQGNSKQLIEEEKIRKNGKKKVETLQDKCIASYCRMQQILYCVTNVSSSSTSSTSPVKAVPIGTPTPATANWVMCLPASQRVEVKLDTLLLGITTTTLSILRSGGVQKERLELMRLHASNALPAPPSILPAPTTVPTLPPPAPLISSTSNSNNTVNTSILNTSAVTGSGVSSYMASTASSSSRRLSVDKENISMNKIVKTTKTGLTSVMKVAKSTSSHHNIGSKLMATKEAVKKVIQSQQRLSINARYGMPTQNTNSSSQPQSLSPRPYEEESEDYESEDGNITYSVIESSVYDDE